MPWLYAVAIYRQTKAPSVSAAHHRWSCSQSSWPAGGQVRPGGLRCSAPPALPPVWAKAFRHIPGMAVHLVKSSSNLTAVVWGYEASAVIPLSTLQARPCLGRHLLIHYHPDQQSDLSSGHCASAALLTRAVLHSQLNHSVPNSTDVQMLSAQLHSAADNWQPSAAPPANVAY